MTGNRGEGSSSGIKFDEGGGFSFNWEEEELDETADLLPSDPFNMDSSNQRMGFSVMTRWLEDFGFKVDENEVAKLDSFLIRKMGIHQGAGFQLIDGNCEPFGMIFREGLNGGHGLMDGDTTDNDQGRINDHCGVDGGNPPQALLLSLGYLGLGDLFVVERVSKPLRDAVVGDPLLWKNINIAHPFCTNITNDILINLTNRAQGHLQSLSLFHCSKLTDAGLKHVLDRNPNLSKLNVQGCARLTADGMLSNLKVWKTAGKMRLKYLGIYGLSGLIDKHMDEFKLLTGVDNSKLPTTRKPRFFGGGRSRVTFDDDRAIDVEVCPICQRFELVYDCTSESCQKKQSSSQLCRGCVKCIKRCFDCGCCLINCDYVELFHFESLCLDCPINPLGSQKGEQKTAPLSETTVVH
ncbi:hypothetical protein AABB24_023915 [Solanum stoloniferum]|uniref:F-box protein SKIP14 n=1 Tax=Solanum stoloniferum TaxID=62892 RepID=A0ABD2SLH4_9SOLN